MSEESNPQSVQETLIPALHVAELWTDQVLHRPLVQATGTIAGLPFYFHAAGDSWDFAVAPTPDGNPAEVSARWSGLIFTVNPAGYYEEHPYGRWGFNDAGFISLDQARAFIQQAALNYLRAAGAIEPPLDTFPTDAELAVFYRETLPYYEMHELPRVSGLPRKWEVIAGVHRCAFGIIAHTAILPTFETREEAALALALVTAVRTFCGFAAKEHLS
jgi:hypothetical protein